MILKKNTQSGFPWWSSGCDSVPALQGVRFNLVRELRSRMPHGAAKKKASFFFFKLIKKKECSVSKSKGLTLAVINRHKQPVSWIV